MGRLVIPRVIKMPVEVQATDALRDAIVNGAIPPGERVTEIQISEQMRLSRATVRTALHQLAKEGLLTLVPYTGWRVVAMTATDAWELYSLRSAVERLAAQLVAGALGDDGRTRLEGSFAALEAACLGSDASGIAAADFALHKTIIEMTRHQRLITQYGLIEQQIRMYIRSSDALIPQGALIVAQHQPIVRAILAGEVETAGLLSEQHNLSEGRKLSDHLRALEQAVAVESSVPASRPRKTKLTAA